MKWTIAFLATLGVMLAIAIPASLVGCGESPNGPEPSITDTAGDPPKVIKGPASAKNPANRPTAPAE